MPEFLTQFLAQRWYVVVAALVILFFVVRKVVQRVIRVVVLLVILAALAAFAFVDRDQLLRTGQRIGAKAAAEVQERALQSFRDEMKDARYEGDADGSFIVSTRSVKLTGEPGAREAELTVGGQTVTIEFDETWKALVEQVRSQP